MTYRNMQGQHSAATDGRNPDGTFTKGSAAAKEAGHIGGLHSHDNDGMGGETSSGGEATSSSGSSDSSGSTSSAGPGRNADGTFTKGSEAAKEAGHKGGSHS
ncbi:hypothetical protein LTR16_009284 [Cryomyces antarcticus]|uniref:Uncharacterized protein n=1 Tax=Cryomyces antarcticus TaxID=329879 RepID=A0ABR0JTJ2_9PEZI|nr:hypothetical protein LTR16_009284 [Cryomyces antarcticus]